MVVGGALPEEADVPSAFPFGGSCPDGGRCPSARRSARLPAALAARLGDRPGAYVTAAALIVAHRYADSTAFRIGVRRASWPGGARATMTAAMPSDLPLRAHLEGVTTALATIAPAPEGPTAPDSAVALTCVVDGPATGHHDADLVISAEAGAGGVTLHADHHPHVHDEAFTDRLLGHLGTVLEALADRPDTPVGKVGLLTPAEGEWLREINDTRRPYPRDTTVYRLFAERAAARPGAVAVRHRDGSLTYRELEERALRLAGALHVRGVRPGDRVAFTLDRTPNLLVAALAVLRLGAAYVPIDREVPVSRRDFLLTDSGAGLLLADGPVPPAGVPVLDIAAPYGVPCDHELPAAPSSPLDPAYVMYTSGTTGTPKGVLVNQRAVIRLVRGADYVELSPTTTILQTGAIAFDATTFEFWGALLNGGAVALVPATTVLNAADLRAAIDEHGVNAMFLTTMLFNQLVEQDPAVFGGCQVLVGGEPVSGRHFDTARAACPDAVFSNVYGPTENTTFSTAHRVTRPYPGRVPIGRPIANSTAWVLDRDGRPQPVGVPGELCVGGDGLGDGYLDRPELTARAFVTGGLGRPERLYRTGDVACWTAEGALDHLGRADHQVKIRGYRVEPGEVESRLARLPGVREAVVLARRREDGMAELCAYFTADTAWRPADLRAALLEELPDYLVPSSFRRVEAMPLNRNHKIDRAALAALEPSGPEPPAPSRAPATPLESAVAGIFAEVLGRESVSVDDDFFDLGGHSLRAMRLWNRLRSALGVEIELKRLLDNPTVAGIVSIVERGAAAPVPRPKLVRRS